MDNSIDSLLSDMQCVGDKSSQSPVLIPRPPAEGRSTAVVNPKSKFVLVHGRQPTENDYERSSKGENAMFSVDSLLGMLDCPQQKAEVVKTGVTTEDLYNDFDEEDEDRGTADHQPAYVPSIPPKNLPVTDKHTLNVDGAISTTNRPDISFRNKTRQSAESVDDFLTDLEDALSSSPPKKNPQTDPDSIKFTSLPKVGLNYAGPDSSHVSHGNSSGLKSMPHVFPSTGSASNSVHSSPSTGSLLVPIAPPIAKVSPPEASAPTGGGKGTRCVRVVISGSSSLRGAKSSAFSKCVCDSLRCIQCNFEVLWFNRARWLSGVDYMFFRNSVPNEDKLRAKLSFDAINFEYCAYCCQCSWTDIKDELVVGLGSSQLQWVCSGHN